MQDDKDVESLHTGLRPTFGNEEQTEGVKAEKLKQKEQRSALTPLAQDIRGYIKEEILAVGDVRSYLKEQKGSSQAIMDEFRARELYLGYLMRFEAWLTNRLQQKQKVQ